MPTCPRVLSISTLSVFALLSGASTSPRAAADPSEAAPDLSATSPPIPDPSLGLATNRTWLYNDSATIPGPLNVVGIMGATYTDSGASTRAGSPFPYTYNAFGSNTAQPGEQLTVGGEIGVINRVSFLALAQVQLGADGQVGESEGNPNALGGTLGIRVRLSPASWTRMRMVLSGGYIREAWEGPVYDDDTGVWKPGAPGGVNGAWAQLAVAGDEGRFRWAASAHIEHVFSDGRDPLDLMMQAGATFAVAGQLRLGGEWVGQDLEETFSPGAEGGARHFIGPIASLALIDQRLSLVAGPAVGLSTASPKVVARAAISFGF